MKIVTSNVLMVCGIILIGLFSVQICSAVIPDRIDLGDINKDELDSCLLAITNEPNLLKRIDQKQNFISNNVYFDELKRTLNSASIFISYDVNILENLSDVNKPANLTVSLCLADSRVYFWNTLADHAVIGWISIYGNSQLTKTNEPKLTVWIIPRLSKSTSFVSSWTELAKQESIISKKSLMKLALNLDIEDVNTDIEQVYGKIKNKGNQYSVNIVTSGNILQAEIMLLYDGGIHMSGGKPSMLSILKFMPTDLPFWPPKIGDKGNEPFN